ncbi:MAG: S-layer homology domain-containing protein, partial [Bacillota bacterium]
MKFKQLTATLLCVISLFCLSAGAFAVVWEDFTDISGHWAEETLRKGYADGLITGISETTLAPNAPITAAQLITVLCRVLGASETADISALGIPADAWYADAAGKALYLGLISADTGTLDAPITRQNA